MKPVKVAITHGDINGIGYEVIIKAISNPMLLEICTPIIYGSVKAMNFHRKALDVQPINYHVANSIEEIEEGKINFINVTNEELKVEFGVSTPIAGQMALLSLQKASEDLKKGIIDILLTAPINKENIQSKEFEFPGHTEYLQEQFGEGRKALMLMVAGTLRVAVYTGHIPLEKVASSLNKTEICNKLKTLNTTLKRDFAIDLPRIAVLGINPHAGDNGVIGKEELEVIKPAIELANNQGVHCFGPYAADGFFGSGHYNRFDAILSIYHDQGLIPFKTIAMDEGVNYTANLSIIRTSPAHGTAYDIAGKNEASEISFLQALYLAIDTYRNRLRYDESSARPLRRMFYDKNKDDDKILSV